MKLISDDNFAFGSLICMIMVVYSGHKMISGNKRTRKQMEVKEVEEMYVRSRNKSTGL